MTSVHATFVKSQLVFSFLLLILGFQEITFAFKFKKGTVHRISPNKYLELRLLTVDFSPDKVPNSYVSLENDMIQSVRRTLDCNITVDQGGLWSIDLLSPG
jgi:hypothetical protein